MAIDASMKLIAVFRLVSKVLGLRREPIIDSAWPLAAVMVLIGSPFAHAVAAGWPELNFPPSMQLQVVSNEMSINGTPMRVLEFCSPQKPDELTQWFSNQWQGRVARSRAGRWDVLAHRERDALITVQMKPLGHEGSRGFIAISNFFEQAARTRPRTAPDVPIPAGTLLMQDIKADDAGRKNRTLVLISDRSPAQNLDFYRAYYQQEGYEPVSYGALARNDGSGAMILNRGAEQLNVAAAEYMGRTVITIVSVR